MPVERSCSETSALGSGKYGNTTKHFHPRDRAYLFDYPNNFKFDGMMNIAQWPHFRNGYR
tara:strand:+ start:1278 stop:1457 length:180 start_codon:yes stop_codon:yes gene_type:complete